MLDSQTQGPEIAGYQQWEAWGCTAVALVASAQWVLEARAPCGP